MGKGEGKEKTGSGALKILIGIFCVLLVASVGLTLYFLIGQKETTAGLYAGIGSSVTVAIILVFLVGTNKGKSKKTKKRHRKAPLNEISAYGRQSGQNHPNSGRGITVTQTSGNPYSGGQQSNQNYGNPAQYNNQGYHTEELTTANLPQYLPAGAGSYNYNGQQYDAGYLPQPQRSVSASGNNMNPGGRQNHQGGQVVGQFPQGSMDSINTQSSDISFGSTGSFYSNTSITQPIRSSLKRPKNKETISTASGKSRRSVTIAIGQEQTAV